MAVPTKGNVTKANPTPGANFKTQAHNIIRVVMV